MSSKASKAIVEKMWKALSDMDWETMKNCIKRLQIAFNHLQKQEQVTHHIAADGNIVFLDHTETWTFTSGETATNTFASMREIKDGLIYRWSDYDDEIYSGRFY